MAPLSTAPIAQVGARFDFFKACRQGEARNGRRQFDTMAPKTAGWFAVAAVGNRRHSPESEPQRLVGRATDGRVFMASSPYQVAGARKPREGMSVALPQLESASTPCWPAHRDQTSDVTEKAFIGHECPSEMRLQGHRPRHSPAPQRRREIWSRNSRCGQRGVCGCGLPSLTGPQGYARFSGSQYRRRPADTG